jgi:hypothetical protein
MPSISVKTFACKQNGLKMLAQSDDLSLSRIEFSRVNKDYIQIRDSVACHRALGRFTLVAPRGERLDTSSNCGRIFRA